MIALEKLREHDLSGIVIFLSDGRWNIKLLDEAGEIFLPFGMLGETISLAGLQGWKLTLILTFANLTVSLQPYTVCSKDDATINTGGNQKQIGLVRSRMEG